MPKALNKANLAALGAERLAELLIEVTKGKGDMQRLLRLELSAQMGADDAARDIRKRYASIRQAKGYLPRKTHRAFAKEVGSLVALIEKTMPPDAAFDLLWELLNLAPGVLGRTKDTSGTLATAFDGAMAAIGRCAPTMTQAPEALAETVFDALRHDRTGTFALAVPALAPTLGPQGLEHLKQLATAEPSKAKRWIDPLLRQIADAQGDIDAYIARFGPAQLRDAPIAIDIAARLHHAGRTDEGLAILSRAMSMSAPPHDLEDAYIAALDATGQRDDLKAFLWTSLVRRPDAARLRHYLRLLPDFEDIEAEDNARTLAMQHRSADAALQFFVDWPDLGAAAALVHSRHADLRTGRIPSSAADRLETGYPLASVLLRRIETRAALSLGTAAGDKQAAAHVMACMTADAAIADYGDNPDHADFIANLRRTFGRRRMFWAKVT